MAGQSVTCPSCGQKTVVVAEEEAAPKSPAAPAAKSPVAAPKGEPPRPTPAAPTKGAAAKPPASPKPAARGDAFDFPEVSPAPPPGAKLQIQDESGSVESRRLSKTQPTTLGSHKTSDIVVDDANVAALHARISWNGKAFELSAAGKDGIDVNGTLIKQRVLRHGDTIRLGEFDISFIDPDAAADDNAEAMVQSILELEQEPLSLEAIATDLKAMEKQSDRAPSAASKKPAAPAPAALDLDDLVEEDVVDEVEEELEEVGDEHEELEEVSDEESLEEVEEVASADAKAADGEGESEEQPATKWAFKKSERMREQQPLMKSPLIMTLGIGGSLLTVAALIFWVMIARDSATKQFDDAKREITQSQFPAGIQKLEEFIKAHPSHPSSDGVDGARVLLSRARVEKELAGSPAWTNALKALNEYIVDHRDKKYFPDLNEDIVRLAKLIAIGAPKTAAGNRQVDLLEVSKQAEELVVRYSPPDTPPTETKKEILKSRTDAEAAILKANTTDAALAQMNDAIKGTVFPAFKARQQLLVRYPDLKDDKKVDGAMRKAIETIRQQVVREEVRRDAATQDPMTSLPKPLTLAVRTRALSEEQSANRVVFALGQDGLFGVDSVTGDPLWRRTVGLNTPFFPIALEISRTAVLAFDASTNQLLMLDRRNGELVWRQETEPLSGMPLVLKSTGQIYAPTVEGTLYRIDAESGRVSARLKFPQKILSPPIGTSDSKHLLVIGDSELAYTLTLDGLECVLVTHLGHQPDTIGVPPLAMGQYVVLAENDRANSCRLRALDASKPETKIPEVTGIRVEGQVRDELILRGSQLYALSGGPRLTVFNVSDDKNQKAFSLAATLKIPFTWGGSAHLAAGPEGQIWFAAGALRKVLLKTDVLQLDLQQVAVGQSIQPVQRIGKNLYVGRQLPISSAVHLTQADGESMQSNFRTIVGAGILASNVTADGNLVCVSSGADTFLLSPNELLNGGFRARAEASLKLPENAVAPLQATPLAESRLAVWTGDADGKLFVIGPTGQQQAEVALPQPLECPPIRFANGVVLPLPGRLQLAGRPQGSPKCDDFLAAVGNDGDNARRWRHLVAIDDDELFVIDSAGRMAKLQHRKGAKEFFQSASQVDYPQPIDVAPTLHNGRLITADAAGTLRVLDVTAMETRAEVALGAAVSKPIWVAEPLILAEVARQKLVAFDSTKPAEPLWSLNLEGNGIVSSPLLIDNLLIAVQQNGDVLKLDPKSGQVAEKISLGQLASRGPIRMGNVLAVLAADGSLHHVEGLVPSLAQAVKQMKRPTTSEKPAETAAAEEKPAEPKTEDKPAESKTDEKPAEPKSDEQPKEPKSDEKPTEDKTDDKPTEAKSDESDSKN